MSHNTRTCNNEKTYMSTYLCFVMSKFKKFFFIILIRQRARRTDHGHATCRWLCNQIHFNVGYLNTFFMHHALPYRYVYNSIGRFFSFVFFTWHFLYALIVYLLYLFILPLLYLPTVCFI